MAWAVQHYTLCDGWIHFLYEDGQPVYFKTKREAQLELAWELHAMKDAVDHGYMDDYEASDFRVTKVNRR